MGKTDVLIQRWKFNLLGGNLANWHVICLLTYFWEFPWRICSEKCQKGKLDYSYPLQCHLQCHNIQGQVKGAGRENPWINYVYLQWEPLSYCEALHRPGRYTGSNTEWVLWSSFSWKGKYESGHTDWCQIRMSQHLCHADWWMTCPCRWHSAEVRLAAYLASLH